MSTRRSKWTALFWNTAAVMAITTGAMAPGAVLAESTLCPGRSIQLIVPWPVGGGTDIQARAVAEKLSHNLNKQIVVVNQPGAGGILGTNAFLNSAKPDGCTLLLSTQATNTVAPYLYKDVRFDPIEDFTPIAFIAFVPNVLYVRPKSPYHTVQDLIDDARANPGKLTYGSGGVGASTHLSAALFANMANLDVVHVPYQGAPAALTDLMGGHTDFSLDTAAQLGHVRSGSLRALAVAAKNRLETMPDVPTFDEAGVKGLYYGFWGSIAGPRGLPDAMVQEVNKAVNEVLSDPKVREYFVTTGGEIRPMTPQQMAEFWREELKISKKVVELIEEQQ